MYNSLRITLKIQFEMGRQFADHPPHTLKCVYSLRIALKSEYGKYSKKTAAGTEYVGAPPCLQAITCICILMGNPLLGVTRIQVNVFGSTFLSTAGRTHSISVRGVTL